MTLKKKKKKRKEKALAQIHVAATYSLKKAVIIEWTFIYDLKLINCKHWV